MSALKQEVPSGYLKAEYGIFPNDWSVLTLDDVCSFVGGAQPEKSVFSYKEQAGYIRLIQIRDYKSDKDIVYIPEKLARKKCSTADIMIGRYGPPIFQILRGIEGAYNVALIKASPKENIEREFLYYFLKNDSLFELMDMLSQRSSGQTGVELPALKSYPIGLPSEPEQRAIANALSDVDALLTELKNLIAKKQAIKTATMQQLLTGKTRLPQFATYTEGADKGKSKDTKTSELGEIPEDWDIFPLQKLTVMMTNGFVGTAKDHYTDRDDGVIYIQGYNVLENNFKFRGIKKVTKEFHQRQSKSNLRTGDVLMVQTGDVGLTTIVPKSLAGSNCHALIISRFKTKLFDPLYFSYYLNSQEGRARLKDIEIGTTMKHVNVGDLLYFEVPVPSTIEEQTAIATILSDMDNEIQTLEQRLAKTRQIKQGMMQQLLTGRTRLPFKSLETKQDGGS